MISAADAKAITVGAKHEQLKDALQHIEVYIKNRAGFGHSNYFTPVSELIPSEDIELIQRIIDELKDSGFEVDLVNKTVLDAFNETIVRQYLEIRWE